ncbi:MAG: peptidylprolyl isomerase [Betaproteobacteria bacterium]|nr:peptidylprolyl isomerase [Betaproteobacteria bacterium]
MMRGLAGLVAALWLFAPACWAAAGTDTDGSPDAVLVVVDGAAISTQQFEAALQAAVRQKYYHRQPPEDQLAALRSEVTDNLVDRVLLLKEAQRRGIRADEEQVRAKLAAHEQRYRDHPQWQADRARVLPEFTRALEEQSVLAQLEAATRVAPPSTEAGLRAYYESHPELFIQPEQLRLSMILLKIDPSSPSSVREQAQQKAQDIIGQLANGADFAELARRHSGDDSARDGGDMGYRHRGTLPQGVETEIDKLAPGAISEPLRLLEGVAVFRVAERRPAQLRTLQEVRRNVAELWEREQGETQWRELRARLRAGAEIRIGADRVRAAAGDSGAAGAGAAH